MPWGILLLVENIWRATIGQAQKQIATRQPFDPLAQSEATLLKKLVIKIEISPALWKEKAEKQLQTQLYLSRSHGKQGRSSASQRCRLEIYGLM